MNKYIIPICDIQAGSVYNEVIVATSLEQCKEKLLQYFLDEYEFDFIDDLSSYYEIIGELDQHDILVGDITDIETL